MYDKLVYLDTYVLQQDMRIRLPKSVLSNLGAEKGITQFDILLDVDNKKIVLEMHDKGAEAND